MFTSSTSPVNICGESIQTILEYSLKDCLKITRLFSVIFYLSFILFLKAQFIYIKY